jgi:hypothetical protein
MIIQQHINLKYLAKKNRVCLQWLKEMYSDINVVHEKYLNGTNSSRKVRRKWKMMNAWDTLSHQKLKKI